MKILLAIALLFVQLQLYAQKCPPVSLLDKTEFKQQIENKSIQLVDVRTKAEFETSHIKGAMNADVLKEEKFKNQFEEYNKEEPVYIYCRSGNRSQKASQLLCELGFKKIYDLKGGYLTWE